MSNQTAAALATIGNSVDWERTGFNLQAIIEAGNRGELGKPLTDWLASKGWEKSVTTTNGKFVAKNSFKLKRDGGICSFIGNKFRSRFGEKVEDPIVETTLCYAKLRRSAMDELIIAELGGEAKAETTLQEIYGLMVKQANGEKGVLLTNGLTNVFYVLDSNGVLCTVHVRWVFNGWNVDTYSIVDPDGWYAGRQVFSRNVIRSSELLAPA